MPGPAFCAAVAVRTKMPVPITAPMPSMVSWNAPSERLRLFFSAVARMASRGFTRPKIMCFPFYEMPALGASLVILVVARQPSGCARLRNSFRRRSAREHRPERPTAENVDVEVRHLLAAVRPRIGKQAVAGLDQSVLPGDVPDGADEPGDPSLGRARGKVVPRDVGALRDHQDMNRRLRAYV